MPRNDLKEQAELLKARIGKPPTDAQLEAARRFAAQNGLPMPDAPLPNTLAPSRTEDDREDAPDA